MIKFGPSGNSLRFFEEGFKTTEQASKFVKENGLDCFEYSFGRGVNVGELKANSIKNAFIENGIEISVHAPYYVNFANPDDEKANNSYGYVLESANCCRQMGGNRVVFHPASVGKETREAAFSRTLLRMQNLKELIYKNNFEDMIFCPETMGKINQIGTANEIAEICKIDKCFIPTIDFGHVNAREQGNLKTTADYINLLNIFIDAIGFDRMKHFHAHFSKIQYTKMGELRHLTFSDTEYGPEFEPLAYALIKLGLEPYIVCESAGTQTDDAIYMKKKYNQILSKGVL